MKRILMSVLAVSLMCFAHGAVPIYYSWASHYFSPYSVVKDALALSDLKVREAKARARMLQYEERLNSSASGASSGATPKAADMTAAMDRQRAALESPATPSLLSAVVCNDLSVLVTWQQTFTDLSLLVGAKGFFICAVSESPTFAKTLKSLTVSSCRATFGASLFALGRTYYARVRYVTQLGSYRYQSSWTPVCSFRVSDSTPPTVPTGLSVTYSDMGVPTLSWRNSTDDIAMSGYYLQFADDSAFSQNVRKFFLPYEKDADPRMDFKYLNPKSTPYRWRVCAIDAVGNCSGWKASSLTIPLDPKDQTGPDMGKVDAYVSRGLIYVDWTSATDVSGIRAYRIQMTSNDDVQYKRVIDDQLLRSIGYVCEVGETDSVRVRVAAQDKKGNWGRWSEEARIASTLPVVEGLCVRQVADGRYTAFWRRPDGVLSNEVQVATTSKFGELVKTTSQTSFGFKYAKSGELHVRVRCIGPNGAGGDWMQTVFYANASADGGIVTTQNNVGVRSAVWQKVEKDGWKVLGQTERCRIYKQRSNGNWDLEQTLTAPYPVEGFGTSVAFYPGRRKDGGEGYYFTDSPTIFVGCTNDLKFCDGSGTVFVYQYAGMRYELQQAVRPPQSVAGWGARALVSPDGYQFICAAEREGLILYQRLSRSDDFEAKKLVSSPLGADIGDGFGDWFGFKMVTDGSGTSQTVLSVSAPKDTAVGGKYGALHDFMVRPIFSAVSEQVNPLRMYPKVTDDNRLIFYVGEAKLTKNGICEIEIDYDGTFEDPLCMVRVHGNEEWEALSPSLLPGTYYYRARARKYGSDSGAWGEWSGPARFDWPFTAGCTVVFRDEISATERKLYSDAGKVYKLPKNPFVNANKHFVGWRHAFSCKRYDDGMLIFNLAQPGETVTMTAIWED